MHPTHALAQAAAEQDATNPKAVGAGLILFAIVMTWVVARWKKTNATAHTWYLLGLLQAASLAVALRAR